MTRLVDAVAEVRREIDDYRRENGIKVSYFGGDEIMMVVNYACDKTSKSILASAAYLDVFLGHRPEVKQQLLGQISREADYNLALVEAAASVYCHASQIY